MNNSLCYNVTEVIQPVPGYVGVVPGPVNSQGTVTPTSISNNDSDCDGTVSSVKVLLPCIIFTFIFGLIIGYGLRYFSAPSEKSTSMASKSAEMSNAA
jgi:hypothetical protein